MSSLPPSVVTNTLPQSVQQHQQRRRRGVRTVASGSSKQWVSHILVPAGGEAGHWEETTLTLPGGAGHKIRVYELHVCYADPVDRIEHEQLVRSWTCNTISTRCIVSAVTKEDLPATEYDRLWQLLVTRSQHVPVPNATVAANRGRYTGAK